MNPELVLVVGDMFIPQRSPDITEQFKSILTPNKVQHVLCLGNIGNKESYDWLKSLSNDFHSVKGDFDEGDIPEKKCVQIGDFNIGLIHGHQVLPWGDLESLANVQRSLGCDILFYGHTHKTSIQVKENKLYINPGSISGAFSPLIEDTIPSFILMVFQGEEAIIYLYTLNDKNKKFEVSKYEYTKGADNYKNVENNNNPLTNEGFIEPKMEIFDKFFNEEENSQKSNMLSNKSYSQMYSPFINYINNSEKKKIINGGQEKNNIDNKINTNLNPIENFEDNNGMKKQLFNINTKLFNIEDLRKKKLIMNRESAKKSRLKKKKYVQNLEKEYTFLKEEMIRLKSSKYVTSINSNNNEKYSINLCSNKIIDNLVKNQNNNININLNLNNKEKEIFDLKNQEKEIIVNNLEKMKK